MCFIQGVAENTNEVLLHARLHSILNKKFRLKGKHNWKKFTNGLKYLTNNLFLYKLFLQKGFTNDPKSNYEQIKWSKWSFIYLCFPNFDSKLALIYQFNNKFNFIQSDYQQLFILASYE